MAGAQGRRETNPGDLLPCASGSFRAHGASNEMKNNVTGALLTRGCRGGTPVLEGDTRVGGGF